MRGASRCRSTTPRSPGQPRFACAISITRTRSASSKRQACSQPACSMRSSTSTASCSSTTSLWSSAGSSCASSPKQSAAESRSPLSTGNKEVHDLVFLGTPGFAATILDALIHAGHRILAVYTQPPRPAGRGHRPQPSPVQLLAAQYRLPVRAPVSLRPQEVQEAFAALDADAAVVAAYGLILPGPMLTAPRLGCLNVHASLLPRWRGAAPIQRALLAGDAATGITIMQMEEGLDTGPILMQESVPIGQDATAPGLSAELAGLGARLIVAALDGVACGTLSPRPQPNEGATYAPKI